MFLDRIFNLNFAKVTQLNGQSVPDYFFAEPGITQEMKKDVYVYTSYSDVYKKETLSLDFANIYGFGLEMEEDIRMITIHKKGIVRSLSTMNTHKLTNEFPRSSLNSDFTSKLKRLPLSYDSFAYMSFI